MEWTDRHYRYMMRGLTQHTQLYTEMIVDGTVREGGREGGREG
jgi:tRNA-dihydrouridine synthase A